MEKAKPVAPVLKLSGSEVNLLLRALRDRETQVRRQAGRSHWTPSELAAAQDEIAALSLRVQRHALRLEASKVTS